MLAVMVSRIMLLAALLLRSEQDHAAVDASDFAEWQSGGGGPLQKVDTLPGSAVCSTTPRSPPHFTSPLVSDDHAPSVVWGEKAPDGLFLRRTRG